MVLQYHHSNVLDAKIDKGSPNIARFGCNQR